MNALFFILFTLLLIVIQTIILPSTSFFIQSFDLMIINVLFVCLVSSHYITILAIIILGIIMDSLSGIPFGFHLFSYLWIYIIVAIFRQFFFQKSIIFLTIIGVVSIAIQHGLLLFTIFVGTSGKTVIEFDYSLLMRQIFWGFFTIPPSIWFLEYIYNKWKKGTRSFIRQWHKARED